MQSCPLLTDLTAPEPASASLRAHLGACPTCRALVRLAAGNGAPESGRSGECDEVEPLIAVVAGGAVLGLDDSILYAIPAQPRPLAMAPAPVAASVSSASRRWNAAVDPAIGRTLRRRRRAGLALQAAFGIALDRCERALELRRNDQGTTLTCAFAACRTKQRVKAAASCSA